MFDPTLPPPPRPTEEWMRTRRDHLVAEVTRRRRVTASGRITALGGGLVAASAAATIALATGPTAAQAFGGWASTPTTATATQLTAAHHRCAGVGKGGTLVLTDTRGPYTVEVYTHATSGADEEWMCITGPSLVASTFTTVEPSGVAKVAAGRIGSYRQLGLDRGRSPYELAVGRVGAGVKAVALVLPDGKTVTATVDHGYFAAWWPGGDGTPGTARVTTAGGTTTQHLTWVTRGSAKGCLVPPLRVGQKVSGTGRVTFHAAGHGILPSGAPVRIPGNRPPKLPAIARAFASGGKEIKGVPLKRPARLACAPAPTSSSSTPGSGAPASFPPSLLPGD